MNREEFFAFQDLVVEPVAIKEMKTTLYVRSLNGTERSKWEYDSMIVNGNAKSGNQVQLTKERMMTARERLVELATCNEDGTPFFKTGDAAQIGKKNANVLTALYDVAARLSGITKEDLEELAKNSLADGAEPLSA